MKKLKNNKGMTGVDIVVSVTLIVITLGIVIAVYSSNMNKTKEVKRTSTATNLAMKVIETIENADIMALQKIFITDESTDPVTEDKIKISNSELKYESSTNSIVEEDFKNIFGIKKSNVDKGYTITIGKVNSTDAILQNIAFQVDVTVSYNIGNETKKVTLSTIKKYDEVGEAEAPNMDLMPTGCIPVKDDSAKGGYVQTNDNDSEWYSISSKRFPVVIKPKDGKNFDRNGVIQLKDCEEIYVWVPSYIKDGNVYNFITEDNDEYYKINYSSITTTDGKIMYYYKKGTVASKTGGGKWVEVNEVDSNLVSTDTDYKAITENIFTW